jgi:hypothetical protein
MEEDTPAAKKACYARKVPNGRAWTQVLLLLVFCLLAALLFPSPFDFDKISGTTEAISRGRYLLIAIKSFASNNGGQYPASLDDLLTAGVLDNLEQLNRSPWDETVPLWVYRPGLTEASPPDEPILFTPSQQLKVGAINLWLRRLIRVSSDPPPYPIRIVVFNDSRKIRMKEEEFQQILKAKGITPPLAETPAAQH